MAGSNGRAKRHFFGGTGLYIALFLGVTALAVAGYWTLLPKKYDGQGRGERLLAGGAAA